MKKVLLITMAMAMAMLMPQMLRAQHYYLWHDNNSTTPVDRGLIRSDSPDYAISYYEENGKGYFAYREHNTPSYHQIPLPDNCFVRDFQVVNGKVIFCGISKNYSCAIVGNVSVSELATAPPNVVNFYVDETTFSNPNDFIWVLNRMAVTYKDGKYAVAAVGTAVESVNPDTYGGDILAYTDDYDVNGLASYFEVINPAFTTERLWDVVVTDAYFAAVSTPSVPVYSSLYIYAWNIGVPHGTLHNVIQPSRFTMTNYAFSGKNRAVALNDNNFTVASLYCYQSSYNNHFYTFEIQGLNTVSMIHAQCMALGSKTDPTEMAYLKVPQQLVLVEQYPYRLNDLDDWDLYPHCIHLKPYNTVDYTASVYHPISGAYLHDSIFSITAVDDTHYVFLGTTGTTGVCSDWNKWWGYSDHVKIHSGNSCIMYSTAPVKMLKITPPANVIVLPNVNNLPITPVLTPRLSELVTISIYCSY